MLTAIISYLCGGEKIGKNKLFLEAFVVIAVVLMLVLPSSAVVTNTTIKTLDILWNGKKRLEIKEARTWPKENISLPILKSSVIQISGWTEGDDRRPAITRDEEGRVFITYQHDEGLFSSSAGFAYNSEPLDQEAWWDNGVIISLQGIETLYYPDTAKCDYPDYSLMNVFVAIDIEEAGGIYMPDPTNYETWEIYTWTSGAPEPELAQISDGGWYQDKYYPEIIGPFNFYIYREIYDVYDITNCPIFFHTGIDAESGVGYFDAQSEEQTAPAADPDIINLKDVTHTSVYNRDSEKIIWKKIDPTVETDYEFTPFQATVADGTNPSIAAFDSNVVIVYAHNGNIKCVYSSDDGDSWSNPVTIGPGGFPDIYAQGSKLYAGFVNKGNLYIVTSKDGGATWSSPEQKNDIDGTVVEEENCIDVHSAGIVFVDKRNDAYNIFYTTLATVPKIPTITGPSNGKPNKEYDFTVSTTDTGGSNIWYYIDWGDDTNSGWLGPYASGTGITESHTWSSEAIFTIKAKAKNEDETESDWANLKFSTPRTKLIINTINFLERFQLIYQLLKTQISSNLSFFILTIKILVLNNENVYK